MIIKATNSTIHMKNNRVSDLVSDAKGISDRTFFVRNLGRKEQVEGYKKRVLCIDDFFKQRIAPKNFFFSRF